MPTVINNQNAVDWKKKYLDAVNELKTRQREWKRTDDILRKIVSRLADSAMGYDEKLDEQLKQISSAVSDQNDVENLKQNLKSVATVYSVNEPGAVEGLIDTVPAEQALIELLGRIDIPENLQDDVCELRQQIESELCADNWLSIVNSMATLISGIQSKSTRDQDNLENFLSAISDKLKEIDVQMQGGVALHQEGQDNRERMDEAVRLEVQGIGTTVRESSDIVMLKNSVESQIDSVVGHMNRYRDIEDARVEEGQNYLKSMTNRLMSMEEETQSLREQVIHEREQAMTDALTQIPNRLAFESRFEREIEEWEGPETPLILLVWDVDHFKHVNDSYGHAAGDKVLKKLASILHKSVRGTDFTARFGGEEFVMLMTGSPMEGCFQVADKLRAMISGLGFRFKDQEVEISASCGLSEYRKGENLNDVFERADAALYKAKEQGRNQCVIG